MNEKCRAGLDEALEDEYKARAVYAKIIETFGPVQPFVNIVESEGRHIAALCALYEKYGLPIPADKWRGKAAAPASIAEACRAAVEGEIENAAMYDRLIGDADLPDVRQVLQRLRAASRDNHLPAFRRCLQRESGRESGVGRTGGRRHRHGRRA